MKHAARRISACLPACSADNIGIQNALKGLPVAFGYQADTNHPTCLPTYQVQALNTHAFGAFGPGQILGLPSAFLGACCSSRALTGGSRRLHWMHTMVWRRMQPRGKKVCMAVWAPHLSLHTSLLALRSQRNAAGSHSTGVTGVCTVNHKAINGGTLPVRMQGARTWT